MGDRRPNLSMKNLVFSALVIAFLSFSVSASLTQDLHKIQFPNCTWTMVEQLFHKGRHHGFYPLEEIIETFHRLAELVPEVFQRQYKSDTKTYPASGKRERVYAFVFTSNADKEQMDLDEKAGILFTGAHRADEPMTASQCLYIALYWVHRYHQKDKGMMHFLSRSAAWFIPVVNPDGYRYFLNNWKDAKNPPPVRKNRVKPKSSKCNATHLGVDLNRNYDFNWTDANSSECALDYPGSHPLTEIETQFVHEILHGAHRDIRVAVNFMGAHGLWRMPHNVTHLHKGHDLYHQVKKEANIDLNDTYGGLTGDVTDYMYFTRNITAFSALVGVEDEHGLLDPAPSHDKAIEMFNKTLWTVNYLYAMLPPNLEHDFTIWETTPPHYIPETAVNASKFKLTMVVQAFNKGLSAKKNVHVGIQLNNGIHANVRHSPPFHMHYEIVSEEAITRANDQERDYRIQGKFTSGELKHHEVKPLHVHWNTSWYHGHQNVTIYSYEAITIPERHFLRVYVLIHRKVGKHVNFDVKIKPVDPLDSEYVLEHVTWTPPTLDDHEGLGGGAIFLIIMTIFLLLFVPLCVCYIYMKKSQDERDDMRGLTGDYMMYKDNKGVEML